jgi:hypothetical protein
MSLAIFDTLKALEWARLHFYIEWTRPDTVRVNVTLVGERIDHIEDGHLEISHFHGNESVEGGEEPLLFSAPTNKRPSCRLAREKSD